MSHPSAATRQRVPAHFARNGRFLEAGARIKVASNFLASFKVNRHIFLLSRQKAQTRQRSAVDCYVGLPFLRGAKGPETAAGSIQPHERGRRGDALPVSRATRYGTQACKWARWRWRVSLPP